MIKDTISPDTRESTVAAQTTLSELEYLKAFDAARLARAQAFARIFGSAARAIARLFRAVVLAPLARRNAREATFNELMSLDAHMLKDIGITRADIPYVASNAIFGKSAPVNENAEREAA